MYRIPVLMFLFVCAVVASFVPFASDLDFNNTPKKLIKPPFLSNDASWADSVFKTLTEEERIAQLLMVAAYSNKDESHVKKIEGLVKDYRIGGLIFFQGGPVRQARLTNRYQEASQVPLMISIDGEWGLKMRLDSTVGFPRQMTLGAIQNDSLIYEMGKEIGRQCKRLGIHVNLAPVADINNNPNNPVINSRSFGENRENVAQKAIAYMKGMQEVNVLANAKHFPGHGDTDKDSHLSLPVIEHSKKRLDSLELYPFRKMIDEGLGSMMVAHLYIPKLDNTKNTASTLSNKIVTGLLKKELGFEGLIFTDALNMKGVSSFYPPGEVDVRALLAGNDVLLFSEDVPTAIKKIKEAIAAGKISQKEVDRRCMKILKAKAWMGLDNYQPIEMKNLTNDLNTRNAQAIKRQLIENSLTLLKNNDELIPLSNNKGLSTACITIGEKEGNDFHEALKLYDDVDLFTAKKSPTNQEILNIKKKVKNYDRIIISIHKTSYSPQSYGITLQGKKMISTLLALNKPQKVINLLANPYSLKKIYGLDKADAILMSYQDDDATQNISAQAIYGGVGITGKLPITAQSNFKFGDGIAIDHPIRMSYGLPEEVGMDSEKLNEIKNIVNAGMSEKAFPGCQVLVAKDGKVVYRESFGYQTYAKKDKIDFESIYDLASITKVVATTASLMHLQDQNKFGLSTTLGDYLPDMMDTSVNYKNMNVKEILAHQARLVAWIPFYLKTIEKGSVSKTFYNTSNTGEFNTEVAKNLYILNSYEDTIFRRILGTRLRSDEKFEKSKYRYSDLGYYFFKEIIEQQTQMQLEDYADSVFYQPLGLRTMGYLPLNRFSIDRLVPTEYDLKFRKQLVRGYVHDPSAAMLGGVGGHAGVFSNADDLAIMMQMYLNGGEYGGQKFLNSTTIKEFTACQFCDDDNRRGAGFDKPMRGEAGGSTCQCVSYDSFGHTGFTGTITWVDPEENIIYVFLSNRVYPDASNKKLLKMNIRTDIQQVIYDSFDE